MNTYRPDELLHVGDVFYLKKGRVFLEKPPAHIVAGFHEAYMQVLTLKPGKKAESGLVIPKDIPGPGEFHRLLTLAPFSPRLDQDYLDRITAMLSTHVPNLQAAIESGWQALADLPDSLKVFKDTDSRLAWINLGRDGALNAGFSLMPENSKPTTRTDINWIQSPNTVAGTPAQKTRFATFAEAEAACTAVMANTQSFPLRPTEPSEESKTT